MTTVATSPAPVLEPVREAAVDDGAVDDGAVDDGVASRTAARLARVASLLLKHLRRSQPGDLTRSQASLLATVRDHGPLSLAAIAALEAVQAPTASRAVDGLVQRDLLRREIDPDDHRRHVIALAPGAEDLLAARSAEAVRVLAASIDDLDPDDRDIVVAALPALEGLVGDLVP